MLRCPAACKRGTAQSPVKMPESASGSLAGLALGIWVPGSGEFEPRHPGCHRETGGAKFFLAKFLFGVETDCSLKRMNAVHPPSQSNVWEPGENPGRLRHCNGYKFPKVPPMRIGKAGRRFEAEVRIPVWLCSSGPAGAGSTSPSKRRMRPACRTVFDRIRWMPSFSVLPGSEGVFVFAGGVAL